MKIDEKNPQFRPHRGRNKHLFAFLRDIFLEINLVNVRSTDSVVDRLNNVAVVTGRGNRHSAKVCKSPTYNQIFKSELQKRTS
jgi:hypothetical protein